MRKFTSMTVMGLILVFSFQALGQDEDLMLLDDVGGDPDQSGPGTVVVLLPEAFQVSPELADSLRDGLVDAVDEHTNYNYLDLPPQTMSDLLLAVGCSDANDECLTLIGEILECDYLLWGDLGASGSTFLAELTLYSFRDAERVYRFSRAFDGDESEFEALLPVFSRGVVFGPVGQLTLEVDPSDAAVEFDSRPTDADRPIQLSGLELGPHSVRAALDGYFAYSETVVVDVDPTTYQIEMIPLEQVIEVSSGRLWTWVALGGGAAFIGGGIAFGLLASSTQDQYDTDASRTQVDVAALDGLQSDGESQALLSNIFFGIGAAGIVTAVVLFFVESPEQIVSNDDDEAEDGALSFQPRLGFDSWGFNLDVEF